MSDTYTKLFSSITESTVWGEPYATRIVWVTMLAMADARGNVYGAVPGLARRANVTLQEVETALAAFLAPDPYSRTRDEDGRRIEAIDGGWRLVNHAKYGAVRNADERREYKREWDRKNRPSGHARQPDSPTQSDKSPTKPTDPTPPAPALTPTLKAEEPKQELVQPSAARSRFDDFWAEYPNKKGKKAARRTWESRKLDRTADQLIEHVRLMCADDDDWLRGYAPMGSTYLNGDRWEDVPKPAPIAAARAGPGGSDPPSKTVQAIQTLMRGTTHAQPELARRGNPPGLEQAALLAPGRDPGR